MRRTFLNRLYEILVILQGKSINNGYHYLYNNVPPSFIQSGLYFFFDHEIIREDNRFKIIRIGITGDNDNNRLLLHKKSTYTVSVFRKHVGRALNASHGQQFNEVTISEYIHPRPYLFLPVKNPDDLKILEKRCIEIVSNKGQLPIDPPGPEWLGYQHSVGANKAIRLSHLWNVQHTGNYDPDHIDYNAALDLLDHYINLLP